MAQDTCLDDGCTRQRETHTVSWRVDPGADALVLVYGVTECLAKPPMPADDPDVTGPCATARTALPASTLRLLATAPATDGLVVWTWDTDPWCYCKGTCQADALLQSSAGDEYFAIVIATSNASGQSAYVIADPGEWHGAVMGCGS